MAKTAHIYFIGREWRYYMPKFRDAILNPHEDMSVVIDGDDQSKYRLPRFPRKSGDQHGHGLSVPLIGLYDMHK